MRIAIVTRAAGPSVPKGTTAHLPPNRRTLASTLLAMAVMLAGCSDNPIELVKPEAAGDSAAVAGGTLLAVSQTEDIVDNFVPRLDLAIKVVGPLVPHSPVVLQLEATAIEAISSGSVQLVLPTMAGMAYVGPDKHPRFPPSSKMPTIGSWTLSGIAKGETWKRSVALRLPEKGYYHVAVDIRTTGPDPSGRGPYLLDDTHEQAWMYVVEAGGVLTREFTASLFPDRILPQPGPFRARHGGRTKARAAARPAASPASSTWLEVVYYDDGRYRPAEGADVDARLYGQSDTSRTTVWRRVPRDGIVQYPCAEPFEYWQGNGSVPGTTNARAKPFFYGWSVGAHQCGDTIQFVVPKSIYVTWSYLNEVIPPIRRHFGYSRSPVRWRISSTDGGSYFSPSNDEIVFRGSYKYKWVVAHEYAHALHHESLGGLWRASKCKSHHIYKASSYTCALQEGLADYAASVVAPDRRSGGNYEHFLPFRPFRSRPAAVEGSVAALFRDLIDATNEIGDRTTYPSTYVIEVFKTCRVRHWVPRTKSYVWRAREDVTDFIWCLENRVDATVHRANFSGAHPRGVSEGAREPSDWNADHIRSTWIKNVGR